MILFKKIWKSATSLLSLVLISLAILSLTSVQTVNAAEIEYLQNIIDRGFVKVGIPPYRTPPFYYVDDEDDELKGYDIEIAKNFAKQLGVKAKFDRESKSFNDLVRRAGANDFDFAIGKLGTTYKRMEDAHPHEYMSFRHALLANRKKISTLQGNIPNEEFAKVIIESDLRIGFIRNSAYSTYAELLLPNAKKIGFENWPKAKKALFNDEIDAIYRDATEIKQIVYKEPSLSLKYVPVLFEDLIDQKSIYLSTKANVAMGSILDYFLKKEIGVKSDIDIMDQYEDFYQPIK